MAGRHSRSRRSNNTGRDEPPELPDDHQERREAARCGWVWLESITNESRHPIHYVNPFYACVDGEIGPGETEHYCSNGFIPYYNARRKYEVTYYNVALGKDVVIYIKDLGGDWKLSFVQEGRDGEDVEHIAEFPPGVVLQYYSRFQLFVKDRGFEILEIGYPVLDLPSNKGGIEF